MTVPAKTPRGSRDAPPGLAAANRQLTKEVARLRSVEDTLRQNARQTLQLLEQSRLQQDQLRHLSRRLLLVQEEERRRISRELHDVVAQLLTGVTVRLATLLKAAEACPPGFRLKLARTQRLIEAAVDTVSRFSRELRPAVLADLGLIPALHSFMKRFTKETGIRTRLTAFAGLEELGGATHTALYRIALDALAQVPRHAQASRVDVLIQKLPEAVRLSIHDDGRPFDVAQMWRLRKGPRLGYLAMRERAAMAGGTFTVESAPGQGSTLTTLLPFRIATPENTRP